VKIGYFADGPWSHHALEKILDSSHFEISFICARFDNPDPHLKLRALEEDIPFLVNENINSDSFYEVLNRFDCDMYVSMSFNQIFRSRIANKTSNGIINCHAGKLPLYRGRNILNWALINDEKEFGVTVHYVDDGIDTGDIILQKTYPITDEDDYSTLLKRSHGYCADVLYEAMINIAENKSVRIAQTTFDTLGFYCSQRKVGDELLDWNQSSREIFNFVRAICSPGPCARTFLNDTEVKINRVELVSGAPVYKGIPGAVVGVNNNSFTVKTSDSYVKVVEYASVAKVKMGDRFK